MGRDLVGDDMKIHKYRNYQEYVTAQRNGYKKKRDKVWASEENIKFLSIYIMTQIIPERGLCHGVRGGAEVKWFADYMKCPVYGTEIGQSDNDYISKWDFNYPLPAGLGKFEFIYSNSFDHAYDPAATLKVWADQLKPGGLLILEWSRKHEHTGAVGKKNNAMDPVSITLDELIRSVSKWVPGAKVKDILDMPVVRKGWQKAIIIEVR